MDGEPGPPVVRLANSGASAVRVYFVGPMVAAVDVAPGRSPEEMALFPGEYQVVVVRDGPAARVGALRFALGRRYGLGVAADGNWIMP